MWRIRLGTPRTMCPTSTRARRSSATPAGRGARDAGGLHAGCAARAALRRARALPPQARRVGPTSRGPVRLLMAEIVTLPRLGRPGTGSGGLWRVIVLNDDFNTFDHVAET